MHFNKKKIQIKKIKAVPVHYENCLGPINICPKILIIHFMKLFYEKLKKLLKIIILVTYHLPIKTHPKLIY